MIFNKCNCEKMNFFLCFFYFVIFHDEEKVFDEEFKKRNPCKASDKKPKDKAVEQREEIHPINCLSRKK